MEIRRWMPSLLAVFWVSAAQGKSLALSYPMTELPGSTWQPHQEPARTLHASRPGPFGSVGVFTGPWAINSAHNFGDERRSHQGFQPLTLAWGLRLGAFLPQLLRTRLVGGAELELAVASSRTSDGHVAGLFAFRALLRGGWDFRSVTPFLVVGGGRMGTIHSVTGKDLDPLFCFGVGAALPVSRRITARFDFRENWTQKDRANIGSLAGHSEVLLSVELRFPRSPY